MPFTSCGGCLKDIFITEAEIIDRYVGNQLWSWGIATGGRLGNNSATNRSSPVQTVSAGTNWVQVDVGRNQSAAIKTDGTLWMWGCGNEGQLGNNATTSRSSPVQTVSGGTNWKQVSVGGCIVGAVKTDGTLWMWGRGEAGSLGNNATTSRSSPVQTVSGGTNWKQVSVSVLTSAAIKTDGTLWLWGFNDNGSLGINISSGSRSSPVQTVSGGTNWKQVSLGGCHVGAIKTDGTLWLWGSNSGGKLGNYSGGASSPTQTLSGGNDWKQVSAGNDFTLAIKTDGTLWVWGCNTNGKLGDNSATSRSSPVQTVSGGTNWKQVSAGSQQASAIKTDGTLWLWGCNSDGQLGNNLTASVSSPVQTVSGGNNWKQVSMDGSSAAITFTEA